MTFHEETAGKHHCPSSGNDVCTHRRIRVPVRTSERTGMTRFVLITSLLLASVAPAAGQTAEARAYLEREHTALQRLMQRPQTSARDERLAEKLTALLDYDELSRQALGEHWESHSVEERNEFVSLLRQLVERNYRENLQRTLSFEIRYEGAEAQSDDVLVRTAARDRNNRRAPPVSIDYLLRRDGRHWRVVDLTVDDGMSMVENYRRQFARILDREGWAGLIGRMRSRLG